MTETRLDSLGRRNRGWTQAGPGRPKQNWTNTHALWTRVENETHEQLKALAKRKGTSMAELLRTYIEWGLENDET